MSALTDELLAQLTQQVADGRTRIAIIGVSADAFTLAAGLSAIGAEAALYDPGAVEGRNPRVNPWAELPASRPNVVVISADAEKERLLRAAADALDGLSPLPRVVIGGLAHQNVPRAEFEDLEAPALVPSYATGNPHTRHHLYDCLRAAAATGHAGAVVELGAFKGGTSVWLAKAVAMLGLHDTRVIAFDSWEGFPPRRSLLDLYEHPRCVFTDLEAVRRYTEPYGVELVCGDIFETAPARLADEPILLAFIDTDNYSATRASLETILRNLVVGGAIVFDHYYTTEDYIYTVGERIAAREVLDDSSLLHLHGTGVFVRLG